MVTVQENILPILVLVTKQLKGTSAKMKDLNLIEDNGLDVNSPNYKYKIK